MSYVENVSALPPILAEAVHDLVNTLQAPRSMIISAVLGAASLACQAKVDVDRKDGGASPVSLTFIVVAESGERKSSVFRAVFKPFLDLDEAQRKKHEIEAALYEREIAKWKVVKSGLERKIAADLKRGRCIDDSTRQLSEHLALEPKLCQPQLMIIQDATPDALLRFLDEKGGSAGLLSDEGGMFFKSRLSSNLASLNSIWSGDPVYVERLDESRSRALSRDVRLTSLIMVQPKTLKAFLQDKGELSRDNGYLARALICQPQTRQGTRFIVDNADKMPMYGLQRFHDRVRDILARPEKTTLSLSPEAHAVWVSFYNQVEQALQSGGSLHACRDSGSKAPEMLLRMAAIFHLISNENGFQISSSTISLAAGVISQYLSEFVRIFNPPPAVDPRMEDAKALYAWLLSELRRRPESQLVEKRRILTAGPYRTRLCANRDAALDILRSWNLVYDWTWKNKSCVAVMQNQTGMSLI